MLTSTRCALGPPAPVSRRATVVVRASSSCLSDARTRRSLLAAGALLLAGAQAAQARDYKAALALKEARKNKLRETAGAIKETGKDQQVFDKGEYSLPDDAHTPNAHSRQNEGARTQQNV